MTEWDARVAQFWQQADDSEPERCLGEMEALLEDNPADEARTLFEWASVHDFLGLEEEAIPFYQQALAVGLATPYAEQATIQLASSLRVIGRPADAVELLQGSLPESLGALQLPAACFEALAQADLGQDREALRGLLLAFANALPQYGRAVQYYAEGLPSMEVSKGKE